MNQDQSRAQYMQQKIITLKPFQTFIFFPNYKSPAGLLYFGDLLMHTFILKQSLLLTLIDYTVNIYTNENHNLYFGLPR